MSALPGGEKSRKVIAACRHPFRVKSPTFQQSGGGAALTCDALTKREPRTVAAINRRFICDHALVEEFSTR